MSYQFTISEIGLRLIKAYEGFWPEARELASGGKVIGFGHRVQDGEDEALSEDEAEDILRKDLAPIEDLINSRVHASMTQSQFDALCSLIFSIGEDAFLASDMLHDLNRGQVIEASSGFDMWRKGSIGGRVYIVDALVRRRTAEKALFLRPTQRIARAPRFELASIREHGLVEVMDDQSKSAIPSTPLADSGSHMSATPAAFTAAAVDVEPEIEVSTVEPTPTEIEVETETSGESTLQTLAVPVDPILYSDDVIEDDPLAVEVDNAAPLTIVENIDVTEADDTVMTIEPADEQIELATLTVKTDEPQTDASDVVEEPVNTESPIAAAAAEVSDRLDALIETKPETVAANDANMEKYLGTQPGVAPQVNESDIQKAVVIDELQRDDALREQGTRESQYNTNRYEDYVELEEEAGNRGLLAFGIMIIAGLVSAVAGLVVNMRGSVSLLGENGPFITIAAMLIGGLLVVVGLLYMLRALFVRD